MKLYRHLLIITTVWALAFSGSFAQTVWPGDINNNGVVNGVDFLYWGLVYGATGPARDKTSAKWEEKTAPELWAQSFPNGLNYYYADCNGDGVVNEDDVDEAIDKNYGETHGIVLGDGFENADTGSVTPALKLETSTPIVSPGEAVEISLRIDDSAMAVEVFYGMAISMKYDKKALKELDGLDFKLDKSSWLSEDSSNVATYLFSDKKEGTAMLAITRTDQQSVPIGPEELGRFSIVTEDLVIGKEIDTIHIQIDSVIVIADDFSVMATQPTGIDIIVTQNPDSVLVATSNDYNPMNFFDRAKAFPNPTRQTFFIQAPIEIDHIEIFNIMGQPVNFELLSSGKPLYQIRLTSDLPSGLILVRLHAKGQAITRKLLYRRD